MVRWSLMFALSVRPSPLCPKGPGKREIALSPIQDLELSLMNGAPEQGQV
jgi:hypothetical protein